MMGKTSKAWVIPVAVVMLVGCASKQAADQALDGPEEVSYRTLISRNVVNLNKLSLGMTKDEAMDTMGRFVAPTRNSVVPNPYRTEPFSTDGKQYEALYYMTRKYPPFTSIKLSQATPVVIEDGRVIGWSLSVLEEARAGQLDE